MTGMQLYRRWRAFAEEIGVPEETLFAAAEGFGLGMGGMEGNLRSGLRCGDACGLQEQLCRSEEPEDQGGNLSADQEITRQFAEKNHALVCKGIEGLETGVVLRSCPDCIRDAVAIAEKVLQMNSDEFILVPVGKVLKLNAKRVNKTLSHLFFYT